MSSKRIRLAMLLAGMLLQAQTQTHAQAQTQIGDAANAWLAMQSANTAAAPAQPMPGAQAGAAYARYMKSFDSAIPEHFGSSIDGAAKSSSDAPSQNAN
jgi:hypothetical protein